MRRFIFCTLLCSAFLSKAQVAATDWKVNFPKDELKVSNLPDRENVWVFMLAGQSNMAGRGFVEPTDTLANNRIYTINNKGEMILAKEPLHWYEPTLTGLDCGLSFGRTLLNGIPENISILLIPTAVGGSSINQWLGDSTYRGVPLFTNFKEKVALAQSYGKIKGILWHQGESDASEAGIQIHSEKMKTLFEEFRYVINDASLPILVGELGSFTLNDDRWQAMNKAIQQYVVSDSNAYFVRTNDLTGKADRIHFDGKSQRELGRRFAQTYLKARK